MSKDDVEAAKAAEEQHAGQEGAEGERPPRKKGKVSSMQIFMKGIQ